MKLNLVLLVSSIITVSLSLAVGLQSCSKNCTECSGGPGQYNGLCKCDGNCGVYGDCCQATINLDTCQVDNTAPADVEFVCRSIYLDSRIEPKIKINESFWMVSSCPSSWPPSQAVVRENCGSLSSSLPPVTDLTTGLVYANEFCAVCNGVDNLIAWQPNLACTQYVYQQLARTNNNITRILEDDPTIFQTQCQACSYQVPRSDLFPSPRPCFPSISTCANISHLEDLTRTVYSPEQYTTLVDSCENGPYDLYTHQLFIASPVGGGVYRLDIHNTIYRNQACAVCNGEKEAFCFFPVKRQEIPLECAPMIPVTEPPTTIPTTTVPTTERPTTVSTTEPPKTESPTTGPPKLRNITIIINGTNVTMVVVDIDLDDTIVLGDEVVHEVTQGVEIMEPVNNGIPFTIALSNLGGGQVQVSVMEETVTVPVDCPNGEAAVGLDCRPTLCPAGYIETGGRCAFQIENTMGCLSETNNATSGCNSSCLPGLVALDDMEHSRVNNETVLYGNLILRIIEFDSSGRPVVCPDNSTAVGILLDCPMGLLPLNDSEYTDLGNDTVMVGEEVFDVIEYDAMGRPLICPPNETTITRNVTIYSYPEGYLILTYVGCSLSVIGSALVLLTYGIFKDLRTLPSLILMNLAAAILMNNLFILIGGPITQAFPSLELCATVAICLHFFFLSQFAWMSIMSFQMARTFYQARQLKLESKGSKRKVLVVYSIFGWGIPLLIIAVSIIVNFTTDHLVLYGVLQDGRLGSCWINHLESAIVAFVVPLVVSLVLNFILFIVVTVFLIIASRSHAKLSKNQNLPFFRVNVAVFSVTGLTWVFGFVAILAGTSWAWYPFIIFNSTQGFVIFLAFLLTRRVLKLYLDLLLCRKSDVSNNKTNKSSVGDNPSADTVQKLTPKESSNDFQSGSINNNPA